jgi:arabinogalactan endo-1,4-beta-galactosidase
VLRVTAARERGCGVLGLRLSVAWAAALSAALTLTTAAVARADDREATSALAVNLALGGSATASSEQGWAPAANAVDGDASTFWCPTTGSGTLLVDLGRLRRLDGLGLTLAAWDSPATVSIALASSPGRWRTAAGSVTSFSAGVPAYLALPDESRSARFARLSVASSDGTPTCVGELRLFGRTDASADMARGADLSFQLQELQAGAHFTDLNGRPGTPVQILRSHAGDYVRLRLWTAPPAGFSDLQNSLTTARTVKAAGMKLLLDLHYSDFWADPGHQITPAAWQGQDLPTLAATVRSYTQQVIAAFAAQGTPVDMVSVGNEIRNGMLWPTGQVDGTANTGYDNLATLLKAGVAGARAGNPEDHRLRIMLHIDHGGNNAQSRQFFDQMVARNVPFDAIGLSFYTFWDGPITALRANVDDVATRYGRDVFVAELQYPWTLANGDSLGNFVWNSGQLRAGYDASPGGQLSFVNDVLSVLAQVPNGHGGGLFYWSPDWIPGVGWTPGAGTPNDNLTLFDFQGHALPSIAIYQNPVTACLRVHPAAGPCAI